MEFKENLKQLRINKGLTQAQLAEKLFVSRSTVAKWENGLGLPNSESMAMLEKLFDINSSELATKEPENVIVKKNVKIRIVGRIIAWLIIAFLLIFIVSVPLAIYKGNYFFTPKMAAKNYADEKYIDVGDYRFYYFSFEGVFEDGKRWSDLQGFRPVKKHFWGCTVSKDDYFYKVFTKDNYVVGKLYTIIGDNGYYNIIDKASIYRVIEYGKPMVWDIPSELITATTITIFGVEYELQNGFFFVTDEPVKHFKIENVLYEVE